MRLGVFPMLSILFEAHMSRICDKVVNDGDLRMKIKTLKLCLCTKPETINIAPNCGGHVTPNKTC